MLPLELKGNFEHHKSVILALCTAHNSSNFINDPPKVSVLGFLWNMLLFQSKFGKPKQKQILFFEKNEKKTHTGQENIKKILSNSDADSVAMWYIIKHYQTQLEFT